MPDAADEACIHPLAVLEHEDALRRVEWLCSDCGRVFAWLDDAQAVDPAHFEVWAARANIPYARVIRYLRRVAAEPGTVRPAV